MPKQQKRKTEKLTPETLQSLDQETLVGMIMRLYEQNVQLSEQLRELVAQKYGPKTERFVDPNQMRLFGAQQPTQSAEPQPQTPKQQDQTSGGTSNKAAKRKGHSRNPMPSWLARVPLRGKDPDQEMLQCKCCAIARNKVSDVITNSRLEFKPAELFVEDFINMVFSCPKCGDTLVVKPDVPEPIENGGAGPGLMTEVAVSKYEDHTPLYRQERRFARLGANISRSTMCGWLAATVSIVRPLYEYMKELLLQSLIIATDDTPIKVLDRKHKRNIKTGRFWIFRGDDDHPYNLFAYTPGRARAGPKTFLKGWNGYLQGDCFSGNQALCAESGAVHVACRAHDRRYYVKALVNNKAACEQMLSMYQELFKIESDARELQLSAKDVKLMREQEAKPILAKMKTWLDQQSLVALPKSSFGKAVNYSLNNWEELNNYLLDGNLRLDNNLAEQEMKRVAIGRKNFLFLGSDNGGENAEVLMSIMSTCRRHNIEPWNYLRDVLQRLTENPGTDLDELLPQNWKPKNGGTPISRLPLARQMASVS
jgi:transposase